MLYFNKSILHAGHLNTYFLFFFYYCIRPSSAVGGSTILIPNRQFGVYYSPTTIHSVRNVSFCYFSALKFQRRPIYHHEVVPIYEYCPALRRPFELVCATECQTPVSNYYFMNDKRNKLKLEKLKFSSS